MKIRKAGTMVLAAAASVLLVGPLAIAAGDSSCFAPSDSTPPEGYGERCLAGQKAPDAPGPASGFVPGDLAFLKRFGAAPPFPVMSAPLPTYNFTAVGSDARPILAMDFDNAGSVLYGIDNTTRELGTIDQATGAFTVVTNVQGIPAGVNLRGLRFDPTRPTVYLLAGADLHTLDIATGATTFIGTTAGLVIDIAIDNSGQMYGHEIGNDELVRIDKTDATSTVVGPTGLSANFAQGMDFDASDGTLYGFAFVQSPVQQGHLVRFDLTTGAATILATSPEELEGAIKVAVPVVSVTPVSNLIDAIGNFVLQPNENNGMWPTWRNNGTAAVALTGALTNFTGPAGATYTIVDGAADYGTIGPSDQEICQDTGNCYSLRIDAATRPATHWDSSVLETVNPGATTYTWTLHVGGSFTDAPPSNFFVYIETILHKGVTGGCTATTYCPANSTTREQMAVFVLVSGSGPGYTPPACGTPMFTDVPASSPFCRWIEELARRGVVAGCGAGIYCPSAPAIREQMAVFVLRTADPGYTPPACGAPMFADVPASSPFCRWIEELARRGVVTGCGGGNYCPTANVTREQMSVFLSVGFGLMLYGL